MTRKVLIAIDHKWRDLPGYVYIGSLLEKKGFQVEYCRNGLERFYIPGFKPNIVIINHLYDKARQEYFNMVADWGVKVVILPTEGIPTLAKYREFAAGIDNDLRGVALHFLWNEPMLHITNKNSTIESDKLKVVGVPRFDFYRQPLANILASKEDFIAKYHLQQGLPIITFATNYTQAQFFTQNQSFFEKDSKTLGYNTFFKEIEDEESIPQKDFKSRKIAIDAFIQLVKDFNSVNFILKPHPSEDHTFYLDLMENELKEFRDRVVVIVQEYIWDILSVTDIELKRSCTTGIESWILGHPTIEMGLNDNEWYHSPEHVVGSDIVTSYNELSDTISSYLHKKPIGKGKQKSREEFLNTWCYKVDGQSTARVVEHISQLALDHSPKIPINFKLWLMYFLLKFGRCYIHDIRVYGAKIFATNKIDRLGRVDKYFHRSDVRQWKRKLKNV